MIKKPAKRKTNEFKDLVSTSSHLSILIKILNITEGKVLELGTGISTPIIQSICKLRKRPVISYETYTAWYKWAKKYETDFHKIYRVFNWDEADLESNFWDVVLVDQAPDRSRPEAVKRLANRANYIILHDTDSLDKLYRRSGIYDLFKYRYDFKDCTPTTAVLSNFKDIRRELTAGFTPHGLNRFLAYCTGVIHVGASIGQESKLYEQLGLPVIWIEPIPEVFEQLKRNIRYLPKQKAYQYLVTDKDNKTYDFHITNNRGESSSIFKFKLHEKIWTKIKQVKTITLKSITLDTFLKKEKINVNQYNALVLDTQGSELLILKGVNLTPFKYIKVEVAGFEAYEGCCQKAEIESFFREQGYKKVITKTYINKIKINGLKKRKNYYDIVYKKRHETI